MLEGFTLQLIYASHNVQGKIFRRSLLTGKHCYCECSRRLLHLLVSKQFLVCFLFVCFCFVFSCHFPLSLIYAGNQIFMKYFCGMTLSSEHSVDIRITKLQSENLLTIKDERCGKNSKLERDQNTEGQAVGTAAAACVTQCCTSPRN